MTKEVKTYKEAFDELQVIVAEIEQGTIEIDELSEKIKRASKLVAICQAKLYETEEEVKLMLEKLNEETKTSEEE